MKILYINSLYSPIIMGGAEISLKLIVEGMKSRGHEVVVLSLMPDAGIEEELVDGVKVYRAGLKNQYWPYVKEKPSTLSRLKWHLKDRINLQMGTVVDDILNIEKPDIVSCHNLAGWSVSVWDAVYASGIPLVQVLHDLYLLCPNSNMFKGNHPCDTQCLSCKLLRLTHAGKSAKVDAVVGISSSILSRFLAQGYFQNAVAQVIYNTRLIEEPAPKQPRKEGQKLILGYLGTLSPIKGVEWLISQFKTLTFPAQLLIAGAGEHAFEQSLKKGAKGYAVEFLGYQNSQEFFAKIDVLVVPSLWQEPLGMVAIEALANHIPVIATQVGGLQETVREGVNGIFCHAEKPETLAAAMRRLFDDPISYNAMSAAARPSVAKILSADRMISAYEQVASQVLGKKSKTAQS